MLDFRTRYGYPVSARGHYLGIKHIVIFVKSAAAGNTGIITDVTVLCTGGSHGLYPLAVRMAYRGNVIVSVKYLTAVADLRVISLFKTSGVYGYGFAIGMSRSIYPYSLAVIASRAGLIRLIAPFGASGLQSFACDNIVTECFKEQGITGCAHDVSFAKRLCSLYRYFLILTYLNCIARDKIEPTRVRAAVYTTVLVISEFKGITGLNVDRYSVTFRSRNAKHISAVVIERENIASALAGYLIEYFHRRIILRNKIKRSRGSMGFIC